MKKYLFILSLIILLIGFILTNYNLLISIILLVIGSILLFLMFLLNTKKRLPVKEIIIENDNIDNTNNRESITYLKENENKLPTINTEESHKENEKSLVTGKDII